MNCDIFFITYDEPLRDISWSGLKELLPQAKRIHGLKGFDAAYKACASASKTERFFTIDGDNEISPAFLELNIDQKHIPETAVLSWSARNIINGLSYGNGGIKNWPKSVTQNMQTHESADTEEGSVDFCFQLKYLQMPETLSVSKVNGSAYQAFRSGFREGVKMLLDRGHRPPFHSYLSKEEALKKHVWHENINRLKIWCSVGADAENGLWAIYGACLGAKMLCLTEWKHQLIRDYDWFEIFWNEKIKNNEAKLTEKILFLQGELNHHLGLDLTLLNEEASHFFKSVYVNPPRSGFMFK